MPGQEGSLRIRRGVGTRGELGETDAESEQEQRENHHQFTTSRHDLSSEGLCVSR